LVLNALVYKNGAHPDICEKWHILLTCGENVHERIIILRGEILAHKTSLTLISHIYLGEHRFCKLKHLVPILNLIHMH
jgi:hypothetical protein